MGDVSAGKILAAGERATRTNTSSLSDAEAATSWEQSDDQCILDRVAERLFADTVNQKTPATEHERNLQTVAVVAEGALVCAAIYVNVRRRLIDAAKEPK